MQGLGHRTVFIASYAAAAVVASVSPEHPKILSASVQPFLFPAADFGGCRGQSGLFIRVT